MCFSLYNVRHFIQTVISFSLMFQLKRLVRSRTLCVTMGSVSRSGGTAMGSQTVKMVLMRAWTSAVSRWFLMNTALHQQSSVTCATKVNMNLSVRI